MTTLLAELRAGRSDALDRLFEVVYQDLRRVAHLQRRRSRTDTLHTTALVHEAYLKLTGGQLADWNDRRHFLAVAARAMRQIVIDHARTVLACKRGGGALRISVDEVEIAVEAQATELIDLNDALVRLSTVDSRLAELVELRFFAGLTVEETADALQMSPRTVKREWRKARAFLFQTLHASRLPSKAEGGHPNDDRS